MTSDDSPILRIHVRLQVGSHRMAGTDDPLFLGLRGDSGREFRLRLAHGKTARRGQEDHFVIGAPDDPQTNLAEPALNDPTQPTLLASGVSGVYLRKGFEPIPNVRGRGEMDDRLEVERVRVEIYADGAPAALSFQRPGPIWLGLEAGCWLEIPRADADA